MNINTIMEEIETFPLMKNEPDSGGNSKGKNDMQSEISFQIIWETQQIKNR